MLNKVIQSQIFFQTLYKIDRDFAQQAKKDRPCGYCGGKLDVSNYLRKPRGVDLPEAQCLRFSLCCRTDGCRKRYIPSSVRFLKGHVYLMLVVLLAAYFMGPSIFRRKKIMKILSISPRTLDRWEKYWRNKFLKTPLYKKLKSFCITDEKIPHVFFKNKTNMKEILLLFKDSSYLT